MTEDMLTPSRAQFSVLRGLITSLVVEVLVKEKSRSDVSERDQLNQIIT